MNVIDLAPVISICPSPSIKPNFELNPLLNSQAAFQLDGFVNKIV
jgi:hypothetical protein